MAVEVRRGCEPGGVGAEWREKRLRRTCGNKNLALYTQKKLIFVVVDFARTTCSRIVGSAQYRNAAAAPRKRGEWPRPRSPVRRHQHPK